MKHAPQPDKVSLGTLIGRLKDGQYVIPDFQREFEWDPADIRELMRSIFLDYYIGSLLLWRSTPDTLKKLSCEPLTGCEMGLQNASSIVLDGQQRLSAMFYAFMAPNIPAPGRKSRYLYFIHVDQFANDEFDDAFHYEWTRRGINLLNDQELQFADGLFPLAKLGSNEMFATPNWIRDYEQYWQNRLDGLDPSLDSDEVMNIEGRIANAVRFGQEIGATLQDYQVSYIELDRELEIEKVCDTFTRINSRGVRLDIFDLLNAMLRPHNVMLKDMWREAQSSLDWADTERMNVYVLQVMSMLAQGYCSPKYLYYLLPGESKKIKRPDGNPGVSVLVADEDDFRQRWGLAVVALKNGIELLRNAQDYGALLPRFLPYISIIPAFSTLQSIAAKMPSERRLAASGQVKSWYWASVFTRRYSGSVESTAARDVLDVGAWIRGDANPPSVLKEFSEVTPGIDLRSEERLASSVYRGVLDLVVLQGARDWLTDEAPKPPDLDDHHIIPQSWGRTQGLGSRIDTVLNRTLLSAEANRKIIGDQLPCEYLPKWVEETSEEVVLSILDSHFISGSAYEILCREPFGITDFEEFVTEREKKIREAMTKLTWSE